MGRMLGNIWVFGMTGGAGPGSLSLPSRRLLVFDVNTGGSKPDEFPGLADGFDETSQHWSVGDSLLELTKTGDARLWSVSSSSRILQSALKGLGSSSKHIMLLAPQLVAFLGRPDALLTTLNIQNGASAQYNLDCPDIRESFSKFAGVLDKMVGVSRRPTPSVIFAAGTDGQGIGLALLSPFSPEYVGRVISFDVTGQCRTIAAVGLKPSSLPIHLISADRELGILCSDGTLGWYPLF